MRNSALIGVCFTFICVAFGMAFGQAKPVADVIVTNAKIWTMDKDRPRAEAFAVRGERIVAVGSSDEIDAWRGTGTKIVDAGGKLVLPGFNDAHLHFTSGGANLDNVELNDAASPEEFTRRIGEYARKLPKGEWILGGNWDEQKWANPQLPTKDLIDALTPDRPVFVARHDGHMSLANSVALKLAGITSKTPDPPGGAIVRDAKGNPTGALKDAAQGYVWKVIPPMSAERRAKAVKRALAHAASLGVTSVQDMGPDYADMAIYARLAEKGELTTRIYAVPSIVAWEDQAKLGLRRAFGTTYFRMGALKGFADGSLGSTTAYFFQPYSDAPSTRGLLADEMIPLSRMRDRMLAGDAAGLQLCTHAIGDAAISTVLDLYAEVAKAHGESDRRWRIEHSQHVAPKDFARYADLKVIASVQPYHAIDDGSWAEKRIGAERARTTYPFKTFLRDGVKLAFGTDWDVAPLNPMYGIYAAVTRATLDGKHPDGWVPEEKISVADAVEAYTMGSAYAEFQDAQKGSISPGKLADAVILSDDIFSIDPKAIKDVKVEKTLVGGRIVYEK